MHDTRIRDTNLESRWIPRTRLVTGGGEQLPCRESCTVLCCAPARVFYFVFFTKNKVKETLRHSLHSSRTLDGSPRKISTSSPCNMSHTYVWRAR